MLTDAHDAVIGALLPVLTRGEQPLQCSNHLFPVTGVDQHAVVQVADDIARPPEAGVDERQSTGRRFDDRKAEILDKGGFYEHYVLLGCHDVKLGSVDYLLVLMGMYK